MTTLRSEPQSATGVAARARAAWALVPLAVLACGLKGPLMSLGRGLWGPQDPWRNGDFVVGWWWWWAASERWRGIDWLARVDWPEGMTTIAPVIPNPLDMAILGLLGPPTPLAWNLAQGGHLVALVLSAFVLGRAAGAAPWASAAGASLVAASPVLLHEVAGGRPSGLVVWPGLLCLACLQRAGWRWGVAAGLLAALQGVAYAWHGLALVLIGLPLVRSGRTLGVGVLVGALAVAPYLIWLLDGLAGVPTDLPQAGYTALPLGGLFALKPMPPRFLLHPLLIVASLLALGRGRRWLAAGAIGLTLAVGPAPTWDLGEPLGAGPWAWVAWAFPPAARMHHPIRVTLLALPVLGVAAAVGLDRLRWGRGVAAGLVLAAAANHRAMDQASSYDRPTTPPFADVAAALPLPDGPVIDLLGMPHSTALSLQPYHRRPILEPLWGRRTDRPLQRGAEALSRGESPPPGFWSEAEADGFVGVLVLDRFGDGAPARERLDQTLGESAFAGVHVLAH
ncbi:MAG: hypothetical protein H6739_18725 [Alphaproteobacteria bacterium]|nr:hypothetical protein [Alphaproteobacteria bacterium]